MNACCISVGYTHIHIHPHIPRVPASLVWPNQLACQLGRQMWGNTPHSWSAMPDSGCIVYIVYCRPVYFLHLLLSCYLPIHTTALLQDAILALVSLFLRWSPSLRPFCIFAKNSMIWILGCSISKNRGGYIVLGAHFVGEGMGVEQVTPVITD